MPNASPEKRDEEDGELCRKTDAKCSLQGPVK